MQLDEQEIAGEMRPRVQLFILARDRPHYLREALGSAVVQHCEGLEIIVSDNSEGDEVEVMVAREFPQVRYVRRVPSLALDEHNAAVFKESRGEYVVYFHDDDVMEPGYAETLARVLDEHPEVAAVGCNAWTIIGERRLRQPRMGLFRRPRLIHRPEELVEPYLDFHSILLAPPCPSYMYRLALIRGLAATSLDEGGIYGDVIYYMRMLTRGPLLWLPQPLIWYRVHGANTSSKEIVAHRLKLVRYICNHTGVDRRARMIRAYRFRFWLNWWLTGKEGSRETPWRTRIVGRFLRATAVRFLLTHPGLWLKLYAKFRRTVPWFPAGR